MRTKKPVSTNKANVPIGLAPSQPSTPISAMPDQGLIEQAHAMHNPVC